jgi:UDP-N-acetylglucosamine transferase subunit ALG13
VTHAGVGSVIVALSAGKRPVVVPRRRSLGEAVDDHQLQLGRRFAEVGLVTMVEREADLAVALDREHEAGLSLTGASALALELRDLLGRILPSRI